MWPSRHRRLRADPSAAQQPSHLGNLSDNTVPAGPEGTADRGPAVLPAGTLRRGSTHQSVSTVHLSPACPGLARVTMPLTMPTLVAVRSAWLSAWLPPRCPRG